MADLPLISVVIPCYNQGRFLAQAIASVGDSSYPRVEIIVVDDGSSDGTPEVAKAFPEVRYHAQPNGGLAVARNRGFRESRGDLLVFLDADDRLAPNALDIGANALAARPECEFVSGRCVMMSGDGVLLPTPPQARIVHDHYRELLRHNYIWMPAMVMIRRGAIERAGGFNQHVNAAADYELYLKIARANPVHDHGQTVAYYRRHDKSMSGNASRMLRETLKVLENERLLLEGDDASIRAYEEGRRTWQDFYGTHLVNEIRAHVGGREWSAALRKAAILGVYHPRGLAHHAGRKIALTLRAFQTEHRFPRWRRALATTDGTDMTGK
jgi:glycosyltransferase involved in cell wall biosynthesis